MTSCILITKTVKGTVGAYLPTLSPVHCDIINQCFRDSVSTLLKVVKC